MKINVDYIEQREEIAFTKYCNLLLSEGAIDAIRRA